MGLCIIMLTHEVIAADEWHDNGPQDLVTVSVYIEIAIDKMQLCTLSVAYAFLKGWICLILRKEYWFHQCNCLHHFQSPIYFWGKSIQWGEQVFDTLLILQVFLLTKHVEVCNFYHRYTSTVTDAI
jgi:hypothetical protein